LCPLNNQHAPRILLLTIRPYPRNVACGLVTYNFAPPLRSINLTWQCSAHLTTSPQCHLLIRPSARSTLPGPLHCRAENVLDAITGSRNIGLTKLFFPTVYQEYWIQCSSVLVYDFPNSTEQLMIFLAPYNDAWQSSGIR
jgi:hypothetical protein